MSAVAPDVALRLDAWLALHGAPPSSLVVLAEAVPRGWPLLDALTTLVGVHVAGPHPGDMRRSPGCRPDLRPRLEGTRDGPELAALWRRADLRVMSVSAAHRLPALQSWPKDGGHTGEMLLWGPTGDAGWAACVGLIAAVGLRELPMPAGWRGLASPDLCLRAEATGWGRAGGLDGWCEALGQRGLALQRVHQPQPGWRLLVDPMQAMVAPSEMVRQRLTIWGRALADRRGNFGLLRPWTGPLTLRLQWGGLAVRLTEASLVLAGGAALTARVRSTHHGQLLEAFLPALAPGQGACLQGVLPAHALPYQDGAEVKALAWEFAA